MTESVRIFEAIEFAFVAALIASFFLLAIAGLAFGFEFDLWSEWQARLVGVGVAIVGVVGAAFGVRAALRGRP